jgi:hypothetical protein
MTELLDVVASWPSLILVIVVFGFTPGLCLRLLVLAYPRSDPRRTELIAELYAVPYIQRPLWVAEQLEVALFEGLPHRVFAVLRLSTSQRRQRVLRHTTHRSLTYAIRVVGVILIGYVIVMGGVILAMSANTRWLGAVSAITITITIVAAGGFTIVIEIAHRRRSRKLHERTSEKTRT